MPLSHQFRCAKACPRLQVTELEKKQPGISHFKAKKNRNQSFGSTKPNNPSSGINLKQ